MVEVVGKDNGERRGSLTVKGERRGSGRGGG